MGEVSVPITKWFEKINNPIIWADSIPVSWTLTIDERPGSGPLHTDHLHTRSYHSHSTPLVVVQ
jgi:hypothetical protein